MKIEILQYFWFIKSNFMICKNCIKGYKIKFEICLLKSCVKEIENGEKKRDMTSNEQVKFLL